MLRRLLLLLLIVIVADAMTAQAVNAQTAGYAQRVGIVSATINDDSTRLNVPEDSHLVRNFEIELREDDAVVITDVFTNLPGYTTFSYSGPMDAEWLDIRGASSITIEDNQVFFVDVGAEIVLSYRTRQFSSRAGDEVSTFASPFTSETDLFDTNINVYFPPHYQMASITPTLSITNTGLLTWNFGPVVAASIQAEFSATGGPRPRLDLPIDYESRGKDFGQGFVDALRHRSSALFDHSYPDGSKDVSLVSYTGLPLAAPATTVCENGFNCLDGNNGYDFSPKCPIAAPCIDSFGIYASASGTVSQAGWANSTLGCRIVLDHGAGWQTTYARLDDPFGDESCDGILISAGNVNRLDRIGTFGGGGGAESRPLHFVVKHNGKVVDPSGWGPDPIHFTDPWQTLSGAASPHLWSHSQRSMRAVSVDNGGRIPSQYYDLQMDIPAQYHTSQLVFYLTETPVLLDGVEAAIYSFTLDAVDDSGQRVSQIDKDATLTLRLAGKDFQAVSIDSLALWFWNDSSSSWEKLPVSIHNESDEATANVSNMGIYAFVGTVSAKTYLPTIMR